MVAFDDGQRFELIFAVEAVEEPVEIVHFKIVKIFRNISERNHKIRLIELRKLQHIFHRRLPDIRSDLRIGDDQKGVVDTGCRKGFETAGRDRSYFGGIGIERDDLIIVNRFREQFFQLETVDLPGNALTGKSVPDDLALTIFLRPEADTANDSRTELAAHRRAVAG